MMKLILPSASAWRTGGPESDCRCGSIGSGRQIELTMELEAAPDPEYPSECTSGHADAPPTVITADIPVLHHECGTPAVGVDGCVVGVIISRFGPSGSFIIPGDCVASRLAGLKAGKPFSGFPAPAAKPPVPTSSGVRE